MRYYCGSSRFLRGIVFHRWDGEELNESEEVVFIPVSVPNPLVDINPVVEAFQLAS